MIKIGNTLISDEVLQEQFVCDLVKCKGGCCVDGDAGAPLEKNELNEINAAYESIAPYLSEESKKEIQTQGRYVYDQEFGWVTPTVNAGVCVYGVKDKKGIVHCGIEQAYLDGKIEWRKPISCHLFPIKIKRSKNGKTDFVNYQPREDLCKPACSLGEKLKIPVYKFCKDALTRKYGAEFYDALSATEKNVSQQKIIK